MVQVVEKRVVRLSWRPRCSDVGFNVAPWIDRLKQRLAMNRRDREGRLIVVQDIRAETLDTAAAREGAWTDFVAVYTPDYCVSLIEEADRGQASELLDAWQKRGSPGVLLWVARLDPADPTESYVGGDLEPWRDTDAWTFLPPHPQPPLSREGIQLDDDLERLCLSPLRSRSPFTGSTP